MFADAGPDGWGRELIAHERGAAALDNPLEVLRLANGGGTGALLFSQSRTRPAPDRELSASASLEELEAAAQAVVLGKAVESETLHLLFEHGSSLGGARPKARIIVDRVEYIAKFGRPGDMIEDPRLEWATLELARRSGLDVPEHRLVDVNGRAVLLVRRFDRSGNERIHYISMHALLNMERLRLPDDGVAPRGLYSYFGAASLYRRIGVPDAGPRMFERMLFNVLVGNTDDHTRNHGLLCRGGSWDLAPAFDLVPHQRRRHSIGLGTAGAEGSIENAFSALDSYGIAQALAEQMRDRILEALGAGKDLLEESGLPDGHVRMALARMPGWISQSPED